MHVRPGEHVITSDSQDTAVYLRGLSKVYDPAPRWLRLFVRSGFREPIAALRSIDLTLSASSICAVVGPNGAGKTTLFRILCGLTTASDGVVRVLGTDPGPRSREVRRRIGWMPADDRSLFLRLSCDENLRFHGRLHGLSHAELNRRIPETLEAVGLPGARWSGAFTLSAGMRARLQLARAILHRPRLLILDEPTASVDPVGAHQLLDLIVELTRASGTAALISSHRLEEIEALSAEVVLLDRGRVRYTGDLDTFRRRWERPRVQLVFDGEDVAARAADRLRRAGSEVSIDGTSLLVTARDGAAIGDTFAALGDDVALVRHARDTPTPLRDVLREVYASPLHPGPTS